MKKHVNEYMRTGLNSGRIAGTGIEEESYGDESFPDIKYKIHEIRTELGRMPLRYSPKSKPDDDDISKKHSEVRIIRPANKNTEDNEE